MDCNDKGMKNKIVVEKTLSTLIWIITSIALFCFYIKIHPFIVFDTDDWTNVSGGRALFPTLNTYNPIKVVPETIMPLLGNIGAYVIYPIKKDYLDSLSISYGTAATLSILALSVLIYLFIKKVLKLGELDSLLISIGILLSGFLMYKSSNEMMYFYYSQNLNCFYNYDFPGIINAITILILLLSILKEDEKNQRTPGFIGCMILLVYLCICSNLYSSIILTSFVSCYALRMVITGIKKHCKTSEIIPNIGWVIVIDVAWFISMLFEINGGRAQGESNTGLHILGAIKMFVVSLKEYSAAWIIISAFVIIVGFIIAIRERNEKYLSIYFIIVGALALTFVYTVLLSAKVSIYYMMYPQYIWGILFYVQLLTGVSLAKIVSSKYGDKCKFAVPFVLFLIVFTINYNIYMYRECNVNGYKYGVAKAAGDDLIKQVIDAVNNGKDEVTLYVPYYGEENGDNWPLALWGGSRIGIALYRHGIISRPINTEFERLLDKNEELMIP